MSVRLSESGIAAAVREAAASLGRFRRADLRDCDFGRFISKAQISYTIKDFLKRGELIRCADGTLEYVKPARVRTRMDVIWHLIRSHRQFDLNEIERLSGAARETVREYLTCLANLGYIRRSGRTWQLVNDPGPATPANVAKCKKLKALRGKGRS